MIAVSYCKEGAATQVAGIDVAEAELIGARPELWAALAAGLRKALVDERVRGVAAGEHAFDYFNRSEGA